MLANTSSAKFEIHYFLENNLHYFDALNRLECEAEFLAILKEVAKHLDIEVLIDAEALSEGGLRNRWVITSNQVVAVTAIISAILLGIQTYNSFPSEQDKKMKELKIKELEAKLKSMGVDDEKTSETVTKVLELDKSNKVRKRRSNFYKSIQQVPKVSHIGFLNLDLENKPIQDEAIIHREQFNNFILHTDNLPDETFEDARIEIVAPVLKEGNAKWRGIFKGEMISFNMKDLTFKRDVLAGKYSFQHGTVIEAVLVNYKELDEVGEEKVVDRSVIMVIKKVDGASTIETNQGRSYKHMKKMELAQQELPLKD